MEICGDRYAVMSSSNSFPGGIASALNDQRQRNPAPATVAGAGINDPAELARLISLIRAAEAADISPVRDVAVGEFVVSGTRVPLTMIAALQTLTRTEAAVLRFVGWGRSNADIASLLNMNENTVRSHITNAIQKLEVDGARELNSIAGLLFHPLD
jgi:DNA-binding NarL/FixJ family response regulator